MSADDHLLLPKDPEPEPSERKPHRLRIRLDILALVISIMAGGAALNE